MSAGDALARILEHHVVIRIRPIRRVRPVDSISRSSDSPRSTTSWAHAIPRGATHCRTCGPSPDWRGRSHGLGSRLTHRLMILARRCMGDMWPAQRHGVLRIALGTQRVDGFIRKCGLFVEPGLRTLENVSRFRTAEVEGQGVFRRPQRRTKSFRASAARAIATIGAAAWARSFARRVRSRSIAACASSALMCASSAETSSLAGVS